MEKELFKLRERLPPEGEIERMELRLRNLQYERTVLEKERGRVTVPFGLEEELKEKLERA